MATVVRPNAFHGNLAGCLRAVGFVLDEDVPEVVLCLGGDGTFLEAERRYPGVPKVLVRSSQVGNKCEPIELQRALELLKGGDFIAETHPKIEAQVDGRAMLAVNDITVRNAFSGRALRFCVEMQGRFLDREFIGDGVVMATPFGSDAYFYSITRSRFDRGFGLAFNNPTEPAAPIYFGKDIDIRIHIVRGRATVVSDNDTNIVYADRGEVIRIVRSPAAAQIFRLQQTAEQKKASVAGL